MSLDGKQRRKLRALGHHLTGVVQVGHDGVTPGVVAALEQALWDHELVKVKLSSEDRDTRKEQAEALAAGTGAEVAQVLGRTVLIYKANPDEPRIALSARVPHQGG
ncbi:MAG TPA: ribosome assembly RNA-binding protein YhbY [Myxococcaceae bacterium]|nr:ribosome assembly RNA-binding protein YhbY [Myxococcaceae bacterium]